MRRLLPLLCLPLLACKGPPPAPTELDLLGNYLFRMSDPAEYDEERFVEGLRNLDAWLQQNTAGALEGYAVDTLDQDIVDSLDIGALSTDALVGGAVAVGHAFPEHPVGIATAWGDQQEVLQGNYDIYVRNYVGNPDCFARMECDWLEASSASQSKWAGLVKVESVNWIQFRWVEVDGQPWMIHRSWLTEPAWVNLESIKLNAQYLLAITMPADWYGDGGSIRMMTTWLDAQYGVLPVSEDEARRQIVKSMRDQGEMIDGWLSAQLQAYGTVEAMIDAGG